MKIRCAEDDKLFEDQYEAATYYGIEPHQIENSCRKPGITVKGKHFHWDWLYSEHFDYMFLEKKMTHKDLMKMLP